MGFFFLPEQEEEVGLQDSIGGVSPRFRAPTSDGQAERIGEIIGVEKKTT